MLPRIDAERRRSAALVARAAQLNPDDFREYVDSLTLTADGGVRAPATDPTPESLASLGIRAERVPVPKER